MAFAWSPSGYAPGRATPVNTLSYVVVTVCGIVFISLVDSTR